MTSPTSSGNNAHYPHHSLPYDPRYYAPYSPQPYPMPGLYGYFSQAGTHGVGKYPLLTHTSATAGPSSFSGTLGNITSATVNTRPQATAGTTSRRGKQKAGSNISEGQKRAHTAAVPATSQAVPSPPASIPPPTIPSIPGVGPPSNPSRQTSPVFKSLVDIPKEVTIGSATDVWYFVRGLKDPAKPITAPNFTDPLTKKRPPMEIYRNLLCSLCPIEDWTTWSNVPGQTVTIRKHLLSQHERSWQELVLVEFARVELSSSTSSASGAASRPYTYRLVKSASASDAAVAQASGRRSIKSLKKATLSQGTITDGTSIAPSPIDPAEIELQAVEEANHRVRAEIKAYQDAGLMELEDDEDLHAVELLQFWQEHKHAYPLLFRASMDVLPTQASAVPCERVFSSSKETDRDRRSNLSPERTEQLQILKFGYRTDRVTFTDDLLADDSNHEVSVIDAPPGTINNLYQEGRITELDDLVNKSWDFY